MHDLVHVIHQCDRVRSRYREFRPWAICSGGAELSLQAELVYDALPITSFAGLAMPGDQEIVRCSTRDQLAAFIEFKRPQLLAYIDHNVGPALRKKLEPEDIFQEMVLVALDSLTTFDVPDRDPFKLLCQIAEQRIIDAHRHHVAAQKRSATREVSMESPVKGNEQFGFINMLAASMTSPSKAFSRGQKELQLQVAISTLSEEQKELLRLRYVEGLPTKDVAERLGKTDGAVRVLLTRTLSKLQEMLSDSG